MIVYEKKESMLLIAQHDHARISGDLMSAWGTWDAGDRRKDDCIYAAYEHDRSWLDLDCWPLWNDAEQRPYSFRDFPPKIRFQYYTKGLNEIQRVNGYAALLCSKLYTTLAERFQNDDTNAFINREYARQQNIIGLLKVEEMMLQKHMRMLFLCDELSLYLCMQEPGTPRAQYEWFTDGFAYSFNDAEHTRLYADWRGDKAIELFPFPFTRTVETVLTYREVSKADLNKLGIAEAYRNATMQETAIIFRSRQ